MPGIKQSGFRDKKSKSGVLCSIFRKTRSGSRQKEAPLA